MKFNRLWIGAVLLTLTTGCYTLRDDMDEFVFSTKNRLYAEQAWMASKSIYSDVECRRNFADGFCDGYVNVAAGGKGCVPKLPPPQILEGRLSVPDRTPKSVGLV